MCDFWFVKIKKRVALDWHYCIILVCLNGVHSNITYAKAPIARSGFTLSYVRNATIY